MALVACLDRVVGQGPEGGPPLQRAADRHATGKAATLSPLSFHLWAFTTFQPSLVWLNHVAHFELETMILRLRKLHVVVFGAVILTGLRVLTFQFVG